MAASQKLKCMGAFALLFCFVLAVPVESQANTFNQLYVKKRMLEQRYGIRELECFPFLDKIGDRAEEKRLLENCLQGVDALEAALREVPDAGLSIVGISNRFLRTGGFHTLLVRWDASKADMVRALTDTLTPDKRKRFMDKIFGVRESVLDRFFIRDLYCAQTISNDQCLQGMTTLSQVERHESLQRKMWGEVVITDSHRPGKNPYMLPIRYDLPAVAMAERLKKLNAETVWAEKKKTYEIIQEKYGKELKELSLPNFFCGLTVTGEQCLEGAAGFFEAARDPALQQKPWGEVMVTPHNTRIRNDYDVTLRFDMEPEEMVNVFSAKPVKTEIEANVVRAEKLEKRVKNNSAGLRAVCDLVDLPSPLCVRGFERFIAFLRAHRDYRVSPPWNTIMFVDGSQKSRVNFALNSKVRRTYLYFDAHSTAEEMEAFLNLFGKKEPAN